MFSFGFQRTIGAGGQSASWGQVGVKTIFTRCQVPSLAFLVVLMGKPGLLGEETMLLSEINVLGE